MNTIITIQEGFQADVSMINEEPPSYSDVVSSQDHDRLYSVEGRFHHHSDSRKRGNCKNSRLIVKAVLFSFISVFLLILCLALVTAIIVGAIRA